MAKTARLNWSRALRKIHSMEDPWEKFNIGALPAEKAVRYRYNALKQKWVQDEVTVKMEEQVCAVTILLIGWKTIVKPHDVVEIIRDTADMRVIYLLHHNLHGC